MFVGSELHSSGSKFAIFFLVRIAVESVAGEYVTPNPNLSAQCPQMQSPSIRNRQVAEGFGNI